MLFSLSILILNMLVAHGRPADDVATGAPERTQEDQAIDDACAPRMKLGLDQYAACVAEKGREAEQERRRIAEAKRLMDVNEIPTTPEATAQVCNPSAAVRACMSASETAARINGSLASSSLSASAKEAEISSALQACRAACNADSAQVLRNFLGDCREQDHSRTKQAMLHTMNNCGSGATSVAVVDSVVSAIPQDVRNLISSDMSLTDKLNVGAQRLFGYSWNSTGESTNSYGKFSGTELSNGIKYVEAETRDGMSYQYCARDKCYATYEAARAGGLFPAVPGYPVVAPGFGGGNSRVDPLDDEGAIDDHGAVGPPNAEFSTTSPQLRFGDEVTGTPGAKAEYALGTPAPVAEPAPAQNPPPPGGGNGGETTGGSNNGSSTDTTVVGNGGDQQVVTPINEPVNYQAGNFAGLQSAMSSPAGGGGIASSGNFGGEVSRGGSSSGGSFSGDSTNPNSRPLAFAGSGQVSPSALRGVDAPAGSAAGGARSAAMDVAAPGGGGFGGGSFADFGGGRMMASSRPTGPASLDSSMNTVMRSDSYYRTSGGRGAGASARASARRSAPCKGPNCPRKTPAGIAAANCDGNPQCLLALTGKLKGPRRQAVEEVWETDSSGVRRVRANTGERGIASVPHKTMPGGVVRGKIQDVLNHLGSSEVFKVDHDGMLEVDL
jgi:hypothetical protein